MRFAGLTALFSPDERPHRVRFALAFAGVIVAWAILHDLYLVHVEPRHFTEYHRPLLPISNLGLLAVQYALVATVGPGLAYGFLAHAACRGGRGEPLGLRASLIGFGLLIVIMECVVLALGRWSLAGYQAGRGPLYPEWMYPDFTDGVIYSQSVNVSAYLWVPSAGALYLSGLWLWRRRRA